VSRGGKRQGVPGSNYSNRTDLSMAQNQKPLAPTAPTGMPYGAHQASIAAQQAVPVAPPPAPMVPQGLGSPVSGPAPGELPPLNAPSARPSEPVTAGLPIGAGPGPTPNPNAASNVSGLLAQLAQLPDASSDMRYLADFVQGRR